MKMYLVSGADHYGTLFNNKASRCMNTKAAVLLALENMFGTPFDVIPFYAADKSGVNSAPLPGSNVRPEHRITYLQVKAAHKHLSGTGLAQMTEFFLGVLKRRFSESHVKSEWIKQPDLYAFLQDEVFRAAVEALCGPHLLSQSPTFVQDFWQFVADVPTLIKGLPRWLSPRPSSTTPRRRQKVARIRHNPLRLHENWPQRPRMGTLFRLQTDPSPAGIQQQNALDEQRRSRRRRPRPDLRNEHKCHPLSNMVHL